MNQRFCDIVGHDRTALLGTPIADVVHPDDRTSGTWLVRQVIQGRADALNLQLRFVRADGGLAWTQVGASVLRDRQGEPESLVAVVTDISEHKRVQEDLERLQRTLEMRILERTTELNQAVERLRTITDNAPAMIAIIDRDLRYRFQNHAFTDWFGIAPGALIGTDARESWGEAAYARLRPALETVFAGKRAAVEYPLPGRSGTMWFYATLVPRVEDGGEVSGFYLLAQDVTERKALYERIEHEATHDPLTGLPNRRALTQRIEEAMARVRRHGRSMAVLFMDMDGFKHMNDTLGHEFGDAVLQHFATGVRAAVRDTDMVGRLAGDEFVIVLEDLDAAGERQARTVATAVLERVQAIQEVQGVAISLTTSIGVAIHRPQDEETPQELLHRADTAMYRAKAAGKRQVAF
jgi:diguanylate cyclase (GGDEF)-like protein/PAS domain S-box-containing protein